MVAAEIVLGILVGLALVALLFWALARLSARNRRRITEKQIHDWFRRRR